MITASSVVRKYAETIFVDFAELDYVQIGQEFAEIQLFVFFKIAAAANLNFTESWIMNHSKPRIANIFVLIKFDANIFIHDRHMAEKQNPPS